MAPQCLKYKNKNISCYLFLIPGKFCNRTFSVELAHHPVCDCDKNPIVKRNSFFATVALFKRLVTTPMLLAISHKRNIQNTKLMQTGAFN